MDTDTGVSSMEIGMAWLIVIAFVILLVVMGAVFVMTGGSHKPFG